MEAAIPEEHHARRSAWRKNVLRAFAHDAIDTRVQRLASFMEMYSSMSLMETSLNGRFRSFHQERKCPMCQR